MSLNTDVVTATSATLTLKRTQHGRPAEDELTNRHISQEFYCNYKVGGNPRRGQFPSSLRGLVRWTQIVVCCTWQSARVREGQNKKKYRIAANF